MAEIVNIVDVASRLPDQRPTATLILMPKFPNYIKEMLKLNVDPPPFQTFQHAETIFSCSSLPGFYLRSNIL